MSTKGKKGAEEHSADKHEPADPQSILTKWLKWEQPIIVKLSQLTKQGDYRPVTEEGKTIIEQRIIRNGNGDFIKGLDRTEAFLVQEIDSKSKDQQYMVIGGNHRLQVFLKYKVADWPCYVLRSEKDGQKMSDEEREIIAGMNNAKTQEGTAKASWFEFFMKLARYIAMPGVTEKGGNGRQAVNWEKVHHLSGNRDGLSIHSAKKLHTVWNNLTRKGKLKLEENAVFKKLLEIHLQYGYSNPIKLKSMTDCTAFWLLDDFDQLSVIEDYIGYAKKQAGKVTHSDFTGTVAEYVHRNAITKHLKEACPDADLLEEYVEAIREQKWPQLETATADDMNVFQMQHLIQCLKEGKSVKSVKFPKKPKPQLTDATKANASKENIPEPKKSPLAAKATKSKSTPVKDTKAAEETPSKKRKAGDAADTNPTKKRKVSAKEAKEPPKDDNEDEEAEQLDEAEDVPYITEFKKNIASNFASSFRAVNNYNKGLPFPNNCVELVMYWVKEPADLQNSVMNAINDRVTFNYWVVVYCDSSLTPVIFEALSKENAHFKHVFRYTACRAAPPQKSFSDKYPTSTTWDFHFLSSSTASLGFFDAKNVTPEAMKHGTFNPNWTHGIFKVSPKEYLREKVSTASTALFPEQPPVQVLRYIFTVFCPPAGIILELNNPSGSGYIAAALARRSYVGFIKSNASLMQLIGAHVARYLAYIAATPEECQALLSDIVSNSVSDKIAPVDSPATPAKSRYQLDDAPLSPKASTARPSTSVAPSKAVQQEEEQEEEEEDEDEDNNEDEEDEDDEQEASK